MKTENLQEEKEEKELGFFQKIWNFFWKIIGIIISLIRIIMIFITLTVLTIFSLDFISNGAWIRVDDLFSENRDEQITMRRFRKLMIESSNKKKLSQKPEVEEERKEGENVGWEGWETGEMGPSAKKNEEETEEEEGGEIQYT